MNRVPFTKSDTLFVKGVAILMMMFHHLLGFPEKIVNYSRAMGLTVDGKSLFLSFAEFCRMCVPIFIVMGG